MNARRSGMKPKEWLRKWMRGDIPVVYSLGPIAMTGGSLAIAKELFKKEEEDTL